MALALDLEPKLWARIEESGQVWPTQRSEHSAVIFQGKMFVFGGFDGKKRLNDLFVFDPTTKTSASPVK